jgi:hypothetical protein
MVKASQEEILQEFGRLRTGSEADDPVLREFRSTSLDQGLKLRFTGSTYRRPQHCADSATCHAGTYTACSDAWDALGADQERFLQWY